MTKEVPRPTVPHSAYQVVYGTDDWDADIYFVRWKISPDHRPVVFGPSTLAECRLWIIARVRDIQSMELS